MSTSFFEKLTNQIKENLVGVIASIFTSAVIVYVISRSFIKYYLDVIEHESLAHTALVSENTISLYTFGVITIFISVFVVIVVVPSALRSIYSESDKYFSELNQKYISLWMSLCFLVPLSILLFANFKISVNWYFITIAFPLSLYIYAAKKYQHESFIKSLLSISPQAFMFSFTMFILILPFYLILHLTTSSELPTGLIGEEIINYIVFISIWILFSLVYGARIINFDKTNLLLDCLFSILLVSILFILSPKAFVVSTAQFVGLKDKTFKYYKVQSKNFPEVKGQVEDFWNLKTNTQHPKVNGYYLLHLKNRDSYYFAAQVIYRDEKFVIVCPPMFNVIKDDKSECFTLDRGTLMATGKNAMFLDGLKNATYRQWIQIN